MSQTKSAKLMRALTRPKGAVAGALALFTLAFTAVGTGPAVSTGSSFKVAQATDTFSAEQKKAIEGIVRDYLLNNPEILLEVSRELEKRQTAMQAAEQKRFILENRKAIFSSPHDFVFGNPNGDITVVEFFDYNCPWCKRALDELIKLTKADPNVKIILKEFPIFGENSLFTAKAAMASMKQGKYLEFHMALMKERQVTKDNVFKIAEKVGLDVAKLKADMENPDFDAALKTTSEIAQALGIEGTPGFIVDAKVNVGFVPMEGLVQLVGEARKAGCQVC
ncbi:MAG: hypothetical protein DIU63_00635 [Proteobacteria bacterium]|jgi:Protein-disulfide isomerase|nr:MAG: hypothetical protein DIU63_00635 [Pseudomonadota bacterium]